MFVATYPNLPAAIGAWLAGEMYAAMQHPELMCDADGNALGASQFDGVLFEAHLDGLLSDLIEFTVHATDRMAPIVLHIADEAPDAFDAQECLQGLAWFTQA